METNNEKIINTNIRLGKLPAKSSRQALHLADFLKPKRLEELPKATNFWTRRAPFPLRTFGNTEYGCCTIAKQAIAAMRMERLETRNTPKITDDEVIRVYFDMSNRLYGGGDNGAYETDALSNWRKPDLTFRDTKGRPLIIDAFLRVNHTDINEVKKALWLSAVQGLAVCFNLPAAWARLNSPGIWDLPEGQPMVGEWMPGTWGGHSMWQVENLIQGGLVPHTWGIKDQIVTWRGMMRYMDEVHIILDSLNSWRKKPASKLLDLDKLKEAVNSVSDMKIK
ncbi:MAG: hypothetical protein M3367_03125 [Acidobacteriota bacterium]|nr:hypothetical protein [Acidobacteriota bacterium]